MFGNNDIALDLGTSNIRVFLPNKGIVVNEPCVVAYNNLTDDIIAIGQKAYKMLGKTSGKISVVYPLVGGVISDLYLVEQLIAHFLKKIHTSSIVMPRVVACIPGEITEVEKRAVVNAISTAGIRKICLIEEPVAAALGAGIDVFAPKGSLVIDIGGGTTDIAVISLSGISVTRSLRVAGSSIDNDIKKYIRKKYGLVIGDVSAETVKKTIGSVYPQKHTEYFDLKGRDMLTGLPKTVKINSDEIYEVCCITADQITKVIGEVLEEVPPELMGDICSYGATITGGSSYISGFAELISERTTLKIHIAEEPELCVIKGTGEGLKYIDDMVKKTYGVLNPLVVEY